MANLEKHTYDAALSGAILSRASETDPSPDEQFSHARGHLTLCSVVKSVVP